MTNRSLNHIQSHRFFSWAEQNVRRFDGKEYAAIAAMCFEDTGIVVTPSHIKRLRSDLGMEWEPSSRSRANSRNQTMKSLAGMEARINEIAEQISKKDPQVQSQQDRMAEVIRQQGQYIDQLRIDLNDARRDISELARRCKSLVNQVGKATHQLASIPTQ